MLNANMHSFPALRSSLQTPGMQIVYNEVSYNFEGLGGSLFVHLLQVVQEEA